MIKGNSVIIHAAPLIQLGLKEILLSRGIGVYMIVADFPDVSTASGWKNMMVLTDYLLIEQLRPHRRMLKKNGNLLVGIAPMQGTFSPDESFDHTVLPWDDLVTINKIADEYLTRIAPRKAETLLSSREIEVLTLVAGGLSNKMIADQLFISIHTVITHRKNITLKLGIKSIPGLTLYAALNNLV